MKISMIAAVAANGTIGNKGQLTWRNPLDMRRFVNKTRGKIVVMGRKTHESIGVVLPGRINCILTRDKFYGSPTPGYDPVHIFHTVKDLLEWAKCNHPNTELVVIGGEEIYRQFLPLADTLYITNINTPLLGDTYFPCYNPMEWQLVFTEQHRGSSDHPYDFEFATLARGNKSCVTI